MWYDWLFTRSSTFGVSTSYNHKFYFTLIQIKKKNTCTWLLKSRLDLQYVQFIKIP